MTNAHGLKARSRRGINAVAIAAAALAGAITLPGTAFAWSTAWVYSFTGGTDGANPTAGLSLDGTTNYLYGTAFFGGANGQGTLFRILTSGGTPSVLHAFNATGDGAGPGGTPILVSGTLLGTTAFASINGSQIGSGNGTVYAYSISGASYAVVHTFSGGSDGANSYSGLVSNCGSSSNTSYTATYAFGTTTGGSSSAGTLFRLQPDNSKPGGYGYYFISSVSGVGGQNAYAPLACYRFSGMFGTTVLGGGSAYRGLVFSISTTDTAPALAYQFGSGTGYGGQPRGSLYILDNAHLFGTTAIGGTNNSSGVVYELTYAGNGNWSYLTLHNFGQGNSDGTTPWATLVADSSGNLYGTTTTGGASGNGTVFELVKSGTSYTYTQLYSFAGASDGANPYAALVVDTSTGTTRLYGTTQNGGANGKGTIFPLTP